MYIFTRRRYGEGNGELAILRNWFLRLRHGFLSEARNEGYRFVDTMWDGAVGIVLFIILLFRTAVSEEIHSLPTFAGQYC